ncbi:hypothetical protein [Clostridium sp.]|jgi:hypothetical protein|uniref:hypothetical protein n=1 Tax=Clostridium sp. TaxID=1506 RepID=UPI003EEBC808
MGKNSSSNNLTVKEVAELLDKTQQFVRIGLQRNILPFGYAVKMSSIWTYHISAYKVYSYLGITQSELNE